MPGEEPPPLAPANPLARMRVLSFCHYLQGPAGVQYLADMGADVIKVEPLTGAYERSAFGPDAGPDVENPLFLAGNRNKRSLAVDLKTDEGRGIVHRLLATHDVVIENYRPGVMARLGLGYDDLRQIKPDVIFASASGYGATGPLAKAPGQDLLIQAMTGLVSVSGRFDERPTPAGGAIVDQHAAALLAMGVLGAYIRRLLSGEGGRVESSLLSAGIDLQMEALTFYLNRKPRPFAADLDRDHHLATWYHPAPYGIYRLADGFIALSLVAADKLQAALQDPVLDEIDGLHPFADRDRYAECVAQALAKLRYDAVAQRFEAHGIWFTRVATYEDVERNPQVQHNGAIAAIERPDGTVRVPLHPIRYDGEVPGVRRPPPALGADTRDILLQVGYAPDQVADLAARRIVRIDDGVSDTPESADRMALEA
jgi:crotonobetainyl-CoA:carnitine CoA-transferase CaiB-like acyl-CoA transferase